MTNALLDWLAALPIVPAYAVLLILAALENVFPPVPADVAVALGAFVARRVGRSPAVLGGLCWIANTVSSAAMYFLGRTKGPAFFESSLGRRLVPPSVLGALRNAYERHGVFGIFVSRFLPGVRSAVTPFAGVVGLSPLRALVPATTASGIWYTLIVLAASTLGLNWDGVRRLIERVNSALGLLAVAATALVFVWLWRRSNRTGV